MRSILPFTFTLSLLAGAFGASGAELDIPENLRPPPDEVTSVEALATGVQIYECRPRTDQPSMFEWAFVAPEAVLVDDSGRQIGTHYAGPTWKAIDGSSVTGEVLARAPGADPSAIPWLLLRARDTTGGGIFSTTKTIQRLQTVGGTAPTAPCSIANAKQVVRVPYTATYYFYLAAP